MTGTFTTDAPHGLKDGDIISVSTSKPALLLELLTKPRASVVTNATASTFEVDKRRMTWKEWLLALSMVFV